MIWAAVFGPLPWVEAVCEECGSLRKEFKLSSETEAGAINSTFSGARLFYSMAAILKKLEGPSRSWGGAEDKPRIITPVLYIVAVHRGVTYRCSFAGHGLSPAASFCVLTTCVGQLLVSVLEGRDLFTDTTLILLPDFTEPVKLFLEFLRVLFTTIVSSLWPCWPSASLFVKELYLQSPNDFNVAQAETWCSFSDR